ncbi:MULTISPECIES: hypothetical protein [unclassified Bartonella]
MELQELIFWRKQAAERCKTK